ncbi:3726_t:CDS:2 [Acaulospora colombiana]|uniref:3726_t:CDS:1 n=1 Tax=Acaulospora colombiana TaxID=27376 RepID=A0ACA9K526_9GLOM|nr:3726_t:CDS:2 [Acaulospora colombiana]
MTEDNSSLLTGTVTIVVFGASGDLAKKKTYPALFGLYRNGFLPEGTRIIGYARTNIGEQEFRNRISGYIKAPVAEIKEQLSKFLEICSYVSGQYDKDESYQYLSKVVEEIENLGGPEKKHRVFYMALPPSVFVPVARGIKNYVYSSRGVNQLIVEKPFGMDLDSSRELGKALEPLWKEEESISNVQITFKETIGTEGRGGYFDEFGIIRDVMQNHLLQILSIVAMERPVSLSSEDVRDEKVRVLRCIQPVTLQDVLLGQYTKSEDESDPKPGYLDDNTVPPGSNCPTYAAATLFINNERWEGVPFILKCGKALNEQKTEIRVQFQDVPGNVFKDAPRNELVIRVQPGEAVYMKMTNKLPGLSMETVISELDLTYHRRFSDFKIPDAYEALILDVLKGDHSNFVRNDELDAAWKIFTPVLHQIDNEKIKPIPYAYGTRGPPGIDEFVTSLLEKDHKVRQKKVFENSETTNIAAAKTPKMTVQQPLDLPNPIQSIFNSRFSISPAISPHTTPPTSRPSTPLLEVEETVWSPYKSVSGNRSTLVPSASGILHSVDTKDQKDIPQNNVMHNDPSRVEQISPLTTPLISPLARTAYNDTSFFRNVKKATGMVESEELYNIIKRPSSPWNSHKAGENFGSGLEKNLPK